MRGGFVIARHQFTFRVAGQKHRFTRQRTAGRCERVANVAIATHRAVASGIIAGFNQGRSCALIIG